MTHQARSPQPRLRRRGAALGALLPVAVLAWALGSASAAAGAPSSSVTLALQIEGRAPADLDLSGVRFELTGPGDEPTTALCLTDAAGTCTVRVLPAEPDDDGGTDPQLLAATPAGAGPAGVPWDGGASTGGVEAVLPEGTYAVRQVTAPVGLLPAEAIAPIEVCAAGCATSRTVVNRSTYRTRTEIQVLSADGPVAGTQVTLSGPGFPDTPAVTDEDGRTAWAGWFRPGEWWFTVAGRPAPLLVTMDPGRGDTSLPWRLEITLPAAAQPGVPAPEAAPSAAAPQPPAQPSTSPAAGAPVAAARVAEVAEVLEVAEAQPGAAPVPAPSPVAVPSPAASGLGQVFAPENAPALGTESSEQRLSAGLVTGTGLLFVALVLVGYGVLRSRQRRRA